MRWHYKTALKFTVTFCAALFLDNNHDDNDADDDDDNHQRKRERVYFTITI